MHRLQGQTAIVTGASTGMGRAIAVTLAAAGTSLAIVARSEDKLARTAAQARDYGVEVLLFAGDVTDPTLAPTLAETMMERFGRIDLLINNAGTNTFHRNLADTEIDDWHKVLETNLTGAFLFAREVLPCMRMAGRGMIVNISSGAGLSPSGPAGVAYSASKHGLQALTGSINAEERRHGIRACVIVPGETNTPNLDLRPLPPSEEARDEMLTPQDIAEAVLYAVTQPARVSVQQIVINPTLIRNYQADFERYISAGHAQRTQR